MLGGPKITWVSEHRVHILSRGRRRAEFLGCIEVVHLVLFADRDQ